MALRTPFGRSSKVFHEDGEAKEEVPRFSRPKAAPKRVLTPEELAFRAAYARCGADGNRQGLINAGIITPPSSMANPTFRFRRSFH